MTRSVIAGVDGSPESVAAARWAAGAAARLRTDLLLLHVGDWPVHVAHGATFEVHQGRIRDLLRSAAAEAGRDHPGLAVRTATTAGDPIVCLVEAGTQVELLVLGSRGQGAFQGLLVGSTALAVAARSRCPVVLVRADQPFGSAVSVPEVVVGVDSKDSSAVLLEFAIEAAARMKTGVRVVHAWSPPPHWFGGGTADADAEHAQAQHAEVDRLEEILEPWRSAHPGVELIPATRVGSAAEILTEEARRASLVVVGRHDRRHGGIGRLGAVAHAVIHYARCPVAVVPRD
ncbi:universal stress protein [Streptacidiphilus pinicola]|uniref:Universal stress protein n=1 Tax=Streptacidiphilus pinicola TaxID=2219663 RepID=A0A2X0IFR2_9ACTN|nr:universal stress protein [Streptacidiphilus pinicola]RAG83347.1 universal stress protein [Streptacidiphilus pinicola]